MLSIQVNNKCEECAHCNVCKWEDTFVKNLETISVSVEIPPSPLILSASCEYFTRKTINMRTIDSFPYYTIETPEPIMQLMQGNSKAIETLAHTETPDYTCRTGTNK